MRDYYVYIIECEGDKLYTGITTDYKRRFIEHSGGNRGAKFTKIYEPIRLRVVYKTKGRSNASKLEYRIKSLSRTAKILVIADHKYFKKLFVDELDLRQYRRCKISQM